MMRPSILLVMLAAAFSLSACTEKPQTIKAGKSDVQAYEGASNKEFTVAGWKAGDKASWEQQIRTRAQGQNEYSRAPAR
jgi:starvation-inducible outer membrane lipoprotein